MFVQSAKFVEHHSGNINNLSIFGQDSNPTTRKMAIMNLAIRGIEGTLDLIVRIHFIMIYIKRLRQILYYQIHHLIFQIGMMEV